MSKKCRAYSKSKLGLEPTDNRKAFYAGWDAALAQQEEGGGNLPPPLPAEPVQEPVAWLVYTEGGTSAYVTDNPNDLVGAYRALALYTAPPQRKPLTKEEIMRAFYAAKKTPMSIRHGLSVVEAARIVERAHGIGEAK